KLLIDESKFSAVAFATIANVEEENIITNQLEIDLEKYKRQTNVIEADKQ
ncbi:DeoR family transcriptional regulator, partial [Bacillus cereus]|nr:DeoR family transcriptional regulator [Bacillus cereus]